MMQRIIRRKKHSGSSAACTLPPFGSLSIRSVLNGDHITRHGVWCFRRDAYAYAANIVKQVRT